LFSLNGKPVSAHRFSLFLEIGPYKGLACHSCDNPSCVRGSHLFAGSQQDNMDDMYTKERRRRKQYKKKEERKVRKLSKEDIETIQEELTRPYWGQIKKLAAEYGVHHSMISHIKSGRVSV
jgi:hypothetical protein